jgi:peptidoglycan lytic transglycosylase G
MFGRRKDVSASPPGATPLGASSFVRISPRSPSDALKPIAPPPPPRVRRPRGGLLSTLSSLLTLCVVLALGLLMGMAGVDRQAKEPGPLPEDRVVLIPRNTGTSEIAGLLKREGVVERPLLFELYALLNRSKGQLKAGEFQFKARTSIDGAIATLIEGKAILHSLTIPEGLTSEQIVARLRENEILSGEIGETPREGSLLPDTYRIERGMTRQQLVNRMQGAQREVLNAVWSKRSPDMPIKTPQELVILASIVEKETGKGNERPRVAGVFHNRLAKRMKLQSDPTIVYGLVGGKGTLGRGIAKDEITRPTPYNTYVVEGLPPGPIANPGRAALEAVASPARTKDLYFVADGTGGHAFAETYDQHLRNVARWRQIEKEREAKEPGVPGVDRADPPPTPEGGATAFAPVSATAAPGSPRPVGPAPAGAARGRSVDAVEGTPRDPLLNRTFDLNSPKTVPALRQP